MLAHQRLVVLQRALEHIDVVHRADVAEHTAAFRFSPHSFARFIGEPLNAALNSGCVMPNSSRASVRASFVPNSSRGAYGESSARANRTIHGHTS